MFFFWDSKFEIDIASGEDYIMLTIVWVRCKYQLSVFNLQNVTALRKHSLSQFASHYFM